MRLAGFATALLVVAACAPSVDEQLAAAERALDAGDARSASLRFAEIVEASERGSDVWLRAKVGTARALASELPERAVQELVALADEHPESIALEEWIAVVGRLAGACYYDQAESLLAAARARTESSASERLDLVSRAIESRRISVPERSAGRSDAKNPFVGFDYSPWDGAEFAPSDEIARLCLLIAKSPADAYERYLALAKDRELSADDCGALALAFHRNYDREHARWVIWNTNFQYAADPRIRDLADFIHYGKDRGVRSSSWTICDY
ncbi:MAG: hypothetical protein HZA52_12070 [Planctomycetes bacterium]|nr:hypothetical protein [Planctomycetota bacterium]